MDKGKISIKGSELSVQFNKPVKEMIFPLEAAKSFIKEFNGFVEKLDNEIAKSCGMCCSGKILKIIGKRAEDGCFLTINGRTLKHKVKHSPTGMEWGYLGSGPADTARSILYATESLGLLNKLTPIETGSGYFHQYEIINLVNFIETNYQRFKIDFVSKWEGDEIDVEIDISKWIIKQSKEAGCRK